MFRNGRARLRRLSKAERVKRFRMSQKLLLAGLVVLLAACGAEKEPEQPPPEQEPGLVKDSSGNTVEYPKGPFGTGVGDVVKNFRLLGYKDGDTNGSYRYISLSDYYNSDGSAPGKVL